MNIKYEDDDDQPFNHRRLDRRPTSSVAAAFFWVGVV
jgi:hypothetical protein